MAIYERKSFQVEAVKYEIGKGLEDGFESWSEVVTNGWINADFLIKINRPDGLIVCPYIGNQRGRIFIGDGDFIITEAGDERHVCSGSKFASRYQLVE